MIWLFAAFAFAVFVLPPRYDPAIRMKYWLSGQKFPD